MDLVTKEFEGVKYAVLAGNGHPAYMDGNSEVGIDAPGMKIAVATHNQEAEKNRKSRKELKDRLELFKDWDPDEVKKALEMVENMDDKAAAEAGKTDERIDKILKNHKLELEVKDGLLLDSATALSAEKSNSRSKDLKNEFAGSEFVIKGSSQHPAVVYSTFRHNFSWNDEGVMVAKDDNGVDLVSKENPAKAPSFNEALGILVDLHPGGAAMRKGSGHNGSGAQESVDGDGRVRTITRETYDDLSFHEKALAGAKVAKKELIIK